jgi:hypothetical protein
MLRPHSAFILPGACVEAMSALPHQDCKEEYYSPVTKGTGLTSVLILHLHFVTTMRAKHLNHDYYPSLSQPSVSQDYVNEYSP